MQFKRGANVYTADGDRVGDVERVVLDPRSKEVTHIVVDKGFLFDDDRVVPLNLIAGVEDDADVHLREDAGDLVISVSVRWGPQDVSRSTEPPLRYRQDGGMRRLTGAILYCQKQECRR